MIINTTGYHAESITEYDDFYTIRANDLHDGYVKTDEQIIREIEQAVLRGHGFIISSSECDRLGLSVKD